MKLKVHPLAEVYPPIGGPAFNEILNSIKTLGQLHPIIALDDMILAGRTRYQVCQKLRIEPRVQQYRGKKDFKSLMDYVRADNEQRRHMTASQRAVVAFRFTKLAEAEKQGVFENKKHQKMLSQEQAAEALGVSTATVDRASKVVQRGSAAVVRAVESDEVTVTDAAAVAELSKAEQNAALRKVRNGKAPTLKAAIRKQGRQKRDPRLWAQWDEAFAKLKRLTDDLGREFPNSKAHRALTARLNEAMDVKDEWMKAKQ